MDARSPVVAGRVASAPRMAALLVAAGAAATVGGALYFQHGLGYVPCKLCLTERVPYYLGAPLALVAAALPARPARFLLGLVALILLYGAVLGAYHAGVEWGFWLGPSDCGGGAGAAPGGVDDFLKDLGKAQVVDCSKAAWSFLGLSLAGWNAVIAAGLAAIAALAAIRPSRQSGSGPHQPGR